MLFKNYVSIRGQKLKKYRYSSGGGMLGGHYSVFVKIADEKNAIVTTERTGWHSDIPKVCEYLVDIGIMDELESVIRRNRMNFWHRKTFTNIFICDGESHSYSFDFDNKYIDFSSQIYPKKYGDKLKLLDDVIKKYCESGEKLPALILGRDRDGGNEVKEGVFDIFAISYADNSLTLRVLNGKDEDITLPTSYEIINENDGSVILVSDKNYSGNCCKGSVCHIDLPIAKRLGIGDYILSIGDYKVQFRIGETEENGEKSNG